MTDSLKNIDELSSGLLDYSPSGDTPLRAKFDDSYRSSTSELAGSVFRSENIIGAGIERWKLSSALNKFEAEPGYNYSENVPDDLFQFRDRFVFTTSLGQRDVVAEQLRKEQSDKAMQEGRPLANFFLGAVIGNLDPTILIPGGVIYKNAKMSVNVLKSAASVAAGTFASSTVQEAALNALQDDRSIEESVYNVMANTILGGAIGGIGGRVFGGAIGKKAQADIVSNYSDGFGPAHEGDLSAAANKTFTPEYVRESEDLAGVSKFFGKAAKYLSPMTTLMHSPFNSARQFVDNVYEHNIIKNKNLPEYGSQANPLNVETQMKVSYGTVTKALSDYQDIFFKQAGIEAGPIKAVRGLVSKVGLDIEQFEAEVSRAIRNGGKHENTAVAQGAKLLTDKVFNPLKDQAIELGFLPKNVDVKTALGYLTRVFDHQKIIENPEGFKNSIRPWFIQKNEELIKYQPIITANRVLITKARTLFNKKKAEAKELAQLKKSKVKANLKRIKELEAKQAKLSTEDAQGMLAKAEKDLDDIIPFDLKDSDGKIRNPSDSETLEQIINQTMDNVLGRNEKKLLNPMLGKLSKGGRPKPLNNRGFLIPDELIEGWTVNNASKVSEIYSRAMIPTIELNKFARRSDLPVKRKAQQDAILTKAYKLEEDILNLSGEEKLLAEIEMNNLFLEAKELDAPTVNQALGQIQLDIKQELDLMKHGKTPEENAKLEKEFESAIKNVNATFELLEGTYGSGPNTLDTAASNALKNMRKWNFVRLMGFMTLTSLSDVGMHVLRHGPAAFMRDGLLPVLGRFEGAKKNRELMMDFGRTLETQMGTRLKNMFDNEGTTLQTGLFGKSLDFMSSTFGNVSLMNQWQDMQQFIAGNMSMSRTLRAIDNWSKSGVMDEIEKTRLNVLGIGEEHWSAIHSEWKKTGGIEKGSYYANYGDWDLELPEVARAFGAYKQAALKEIDTTVVVPGLGDKPLFAQTEIGKTVLQFKTFMMATTNRVLISGLSRNDANFYMGVVSMMGMAALSYYLTSKIRNPDKEVDLAPAKLAREMVDRSGVLGVFMEGYNISEKLLGIDGASRYRSRGRVGALAGPTVGAIEDVLEVLNKVTASISDEDVNLTDKDAQKMLRLMPYQNLFYLYNINRTVTQKAALGLGFEETD